MSDRLSLGPDELERGVPPLTATVSMAFKANLGNYQSADVFVSIGGIRADTTDEEIQTMLDGPAHVAYMNVKTRVFDQVRSLRNAEKMKSLP